LIFEWIAIWVAPISDNLELIGIGTSERKTMRVNYKGNKMRKEAARKQEQEAKRMKRLGRNSDSPQMPSAENAPPVEGTNPPAA